MIRRALGCGLALVALAAGCGEKEEPELSGPPTAPPAPAAAEAGDGTGGVRLVRVGRFDQPVFLAQPPGEGALYVVEQPGRIVRLAPAGRRSTFLDLRGRVSCCGEQGLLSMAFAPDFARSGRFYVNYTDRAGDTRVVEYRRSRREPRAADPRSSRPLLRIDQPAVNHNGGLLLFGPDRRLYVGTGDGGGAGDPERNGQDLGTLLGKILRIDPRPDGRAPYRIPRDNPFVGREAARAEIFAYGLRNPWRFSFDSATGDLWIADVGQDEQEEVDFLPAGEAGANFGWSAWEGTERFNEDEQAPGHVRPVLTYGRDRGCSITGGHVVRERALASLYGRYLYADFCQGQLRSFAAAGAARRGPIGDDRPLGLQVPALSSFAEDRRGRSYALSLEGPVYRLAPAPD